MKKILTILLVSFGSLLLASCSHPQQPQVVYVQQPQAQYAQQPQQPVQTQDVAYNDPQYASQPPVLYNYNGTNILIDAALMAYLYNNHINPGYYYSTHRSYSHFHVYANGRYSGYSGTPRYVTSSSYHYVAPRAQYVNHSTVTHTYQRTSVSAPGSSQRSFTTHTTTTVRSGGFGGSSRSSFSHSSSFGRHR